ncbi:MAG: hypothetical protein QOJ03_1322 [Frankiaceae bacterium]|jgi:hypothetical protein|nr:hypothetical protein [Frankiaceae bacterium]
MASPEPQHSAISKLLLNRGSEADEIGAPAFSITKVLATGAVVLTPLTTVLVKSLSNVKFSNGEIVALVIAVLAFCAILGAADVFARAIATAGTSSVGYVPLSPGLKGSLKKRGEDTDVNIVATRRNGELGEFLIIDDGGASWVKEEAVAVWNKR